MAGVCRAPRRPRGHELNVNACILTFVAYRAHDYEQPSCRAMAYSGRPATVRLQRQGGRRITFLYVSPLPRNPLAVCLQRHPGTLLLHRGALSRGTSMGRGRNKRSISWCPSHTATDAPKPPRIPPTPSFNRVIGADSHCRACSHHDAIRQVPVYTGAARPALFHRELFGQPA